MRTSIQLYSADPAAADPAHIVPAIATLDFSSELEVSRTVGPAKWLEINKRSLAGKSVAFPKENLSEVRHTDPDKIAALAKKNSVLTVSYSCTRSTRISALAAAINTQVPEKARGFFWSGASFSFGPSDIIDFTEDDEGEEDVKLVAVAQFSFRIACDNFPGSPKLLESSLPSIPEFVSLREDLENIVGPLTLRINC